MPSPPWLFTHSSTSLFISCFGAVFQRAKWEWVAVDGRSAVQQSQVRYLFMVKAHKRVKPKAGNAIEDCATAHMSCDARDAVTQSRVVHPLSRPVSIIGTTGKKIGERVSKTRQKA